MIGLPFLFVALFVAARPEGRHAQRPGHRDIGPPLEPADHGQAPVSAETARCLSQEAASFFSWTRVEERGYLQRRHRRAVEPGFERNVSRSTRRCLPPRPPRGGFRTIPTMATAGFPCQTQRETKDSRPEIQLERIPSCPSGPIDPDAAEISLAGS